MTVDMAKLAHDIREGYRGVIDLGAQDELERRCVELRAGGPGTATEHDVVVTEELAVAIEALHRRFPGVSVPPADIRTTLGLSGWLIYEVSWDFLRLVATDFNDLTGDDRAASDVALAKLERTANAARRLKWPDFAPRALGSIRGQALAESKRNTTIGFSNASLLHREAREKYRDYREQVRDFPEVVEALDEVLVQLAVAEAGTGCREAELAFARWDQTQPAGDEEETLFRKMFARLGEGAAAGDNAVAALTKRLDDRDRPLGERVDRDHLVTRTGFRQPGIMTARAHLIQLPMTSVMERWDIEPAEYESWDEIRAATLVRAVKAYRSVERTVEGHPFADPSQRRSLIQIRLNLALIQPGFELPSALVLTDSASDRHLAVCLSHAVLDSGAVEEMSAWLGGEGSDRGDANIIGSAIAPTYLAALQLHSPDSWDDYKQWRRRWSKLDRHAKDPGRIDTVEAAIELAERIAAELT